eukprot:7559314-Pyramimonas_sp.AAC.1
MLRWASLGLALVFRSVPGKVARVRSVEGCQRWLKRLAKDAAAPGDHTWFRNPAWADATEGDNASCAC